MELSLQKLKTYSNPRKIATATPNEHNTTSEIPQKPKPLVIKAKRGPLTTKKGIEFLLNGKLKNLVCRFCLNVTVALTELDQCMQIAGRGALYSVAIRDILATVHPFKVADDPNLPDKICERCIDKALQSYLFAQQCEQSDRALKNYFNDMYDKLEKLDPLERTKKRGRQKRNPNHNVLHAEHRHVIEYAEPIINLINSGSESLTKETQMGELECKKCWQVLPNVESLANHENLHPKSMWYSCRICAKSFAKRYQMNRHLRQHDKDKNLDLENETDFLCKDCGQTNQNYPEHLQHIEKHKFKMVLDHLISRQMDKLCSVCLDRNGKMVEMDNRICLHGGYPELTGDRTMYNILSSTVPEPNYKYQELMVANRPKIMKISKKSDTAIPAKAGKPPGSFKLPFPLIISFDKEIYEESYLFTFAGPNRDLLIYVEDESDDDLKDIDQKLTDIDIEELTETEIEVPTSKSKDLSDVEDSGNLIVDSQLDNMETNNYTSFEFSKPDYDIDLSKIESKQEDCKFCWIFKEPKCKNCVENRKEDVIEIEMQSSEATKECSYCWMFNNVDKCDNCHRPTKIMKNSEDTTETKEVDTFEAAMKKARDEKDRSSSPATVAKKRKQLKEPIKFPKIKKLKWQCNVCLTTNNYNRETCICCECAKLCEGYVKVNLNPEKSKFTFPWFQLTESKTSGISVEPKETTVPKIESVMPKDNEKAEIVTKEETIKDSVEIQIIEPMDSSSSPPRPAENTITTANDYAETMDVVTEQELPTKTEVSATKIQFPTRMSIPHNYTGTKICEKCLNHAITTYIFINKTHYIRNRLDTCITKMLEGLKDVQTDSKIAIEVSQTSIMPILDTIDESFFMDPEEVDERKLPVDVLEDEFRLKSDESSDESVKEEPVSPKKVSKTAVKKPINSVNTKLVNGFTKNMDVCSEFLTFKKEEPKPKKTKCKYTCPMCSKHFISDYFLQKHVLKHVNVKSKCKICCQSFASKFDLCEHVRMSHLLQIKSFSSCRICGRNFKSDTKRLQHEKSHKSKQCELCTKFFRTQKHFDNHLQRHAYKLRMSIQKSTQNCSLCEKECSSDENLSTHVNKVHLQIKPYSCDMCERQFYTESNLRNHKKIHSLRSKEKCEFCSKSFKCRRDLVVHLRKHMGTKPYHCFVCSETFYSEATVKKHLKVWHGGSFCCKLCKKVFVSKKGLKDHVNMAHSFF